MVGTFLFMQKLAYKFQITLIDFVERLHFHNSSSSAKMCFILYNRLGAPNLVNGSVLASIIDLRRRETDHSEKVVVVSQKSSKFY